MAGDSEPAGLARCGAYHDGWLPYTPSPEEYRDGLDRVLVAAEEAGRAPSTITPGRYATVAVGEGRDPYTRLDAYCNAYYGLPAAVMGDLQALITGSVGAVVERLSQYIDAGAEHIVIRHATLDVRSVVAEATLLQEALRAATSA